MYVARDATTQSPGPMTDASTHRDAILALITQQPGISDREIAGALFGVGTSGNMVTPLCRELASQGRTRRRLRPDALLGNWIAGEDPPHG
jgi:hypothetical protein